MEIAHRLLGDNLRHNEHDVFKGHHYWRVGYLPDFNIQAVEMQVRRELDEIEWLFVTTGRTIDYRGQILSTFGMAPILPKTLTVGYHATRACLIPRICGAHGEGLLPSNVARRATHFPDTEGVIHICEKLAHEGTENDSAQWWMLNLSKRNRFNDPDWGIVEIDMAQLPPAARVYQDMHSASGVIVDRIDKILGKLVREVDWDRSFTTVE